MTTPKLALIPCGYKASKVYSVLPTDGTGDFTFSRAGAATRVNSEGLIEEVLSNVPRLNYSLIDGVVQNCPSLLLEPARTNIITYSEDFSNAYWTKTGSSVVSGFVSPKGDLSAFKLVEDTSTAVHTINTITSAVGSNYSLSIFAKAGERRYISLAFSDLAEWLSQYTFDLTDGVLTDTYNFTGVTSIFKSEVLADGWYKLSLSSNYTFVTNVYSRIFIEETATPPTIPTNSYTGDGTSGVYIFGAQLEQGSYATSYIPTQGSIGTRVDESCSQTPPSGIIGQTEGTMFVEAKIEGIKDSNTLFAIHNGTFDEYLVISGNSSGQVNAYIYADGTQQTAILSGTYAVDSVVKCAFAYKNNDVAYYINGVQIGTDSSATMADTSIVNLGNISFFNAPLHGTVKQAQLYTTRLSNAELQALTKI